MRLAPGTRVGPYEVLALLGAGGMAEVYRAKDTRLGRDVALKVVSEALGTDAALVERFEREAKLAGSLNHPNIVALYDVGFQDGKPYFVTELLQGESLRERLARGQIPLPAALEWAAQMAQGLAAAHERGIVHRDLKPENVFITKDGHVKLIDFGIAKLVEAAREAAPHGLMDETASPSGSSTGTGMVLGTPGYMSPEQVRGDPVDARTDFFSLGAVLYEMLAGHRAFASGSVVESGYAILHSEPEALAASVPPPVAQVVRRCLEKDAARRFQSARDLAFYLEVLRTPTGSGPVPAAEPGAATRASGWRLWLWPVVAAMAVLGLAATLYLRRGKPPQRLTVEQITFRHGTVSTARFAPDGKILYSAAWGSEHEVLYSSSPGSPDAQTLSAQDTHLLAISSDGELAVSLSPLWFGVFGEGGTLALMPSVGGAPRPVAENIVFADWSPTGELAVVRFVDGTRVLEYPLGTKVFESEGTISAPRISPSGDTVAFAHYSLVGPHEVRLVDKKGSTRTLTTGGFISGVAWAPDGKEVWFSEGDAIWASPLAGGRRLVYQGLSGMSLEDISRNGKVLVSSVDFRREIVFVPPAPEAPRELPFLDFISLDGLSDDGRRILFTAYPKNAPVIYVRQTDGALPLKLGDGYGLTFSPDDQWVLSAKSHKLSVVPIGVGVAKTLSLGDVDVLIVRWLKDGRFVATAPGKDDKVWRLYVVPAGGGQPSQLSNAPVLPPYLEVSRDGRLAAATSRNGILTLFPLDGSAPIPVPELGKYAVPVGWTSAGQLWASDNLRTVRGAASHLLRYDVGSRRIVEQRSLSSAEPTGLTAIGRIRITPDSRTYAYEYFRELDYLYVLDGLVPSVN
jgi:eukaryotic-like serine/threonine-protein kinase